MRRLTIIGAAAVLLAGCGTETASFLLSGADVAMTLERTKAYPWSSGWDVEMVVRTNPLCQRRHVLRRAADGAFKMEVYNTAPSAFILHQGKHWYITDMKTCDLQEYKEPPPEPGKLVGTFREQGGALAFVQEKSAEAEQAAPAGDQAAQGGGQGN